MIITAARADRTSFGCGTQSEITDFGRAFFVDGLNHNDSFEAAFDEARPLIASIDGVASNADIRGFKRGRCFRERHPGRGPSPSRVPGTG